MTSPEPRTIKVDDDEGDASPASSARIETIDAGLARRARDGDDQAFGDLYRRHAPMVHAVLLSRVPAREADDLMQEVFLAAWRGLQSLRQQDHVGAWLGGIARNMIRRLYARGRPAPEPLPESVADPKPTHHHGEDILSVLRTLPEAYRDTLTMRLVEGLSGLEIAASTGLTPGSVRVNLSRGMKHLREALRQEGWS